jgi:hypothetical protein
MDPNEALREIRSLVEHYQGSDHMAPPRDPEVDVTRLTELFDALDTWLSTGGFPPRDWERTVV